MLDRIKDLVAHSHPNPSLLELFKLMAKKTLDKLDPLERAKRARPRRVRAKPVPTAAAQTPAQMTPAQTPAPGDARRPDAATLHALYQRDQGACQYVDPKSGRKCGSKRALEVEHKIPYAMGGKTELENLELLCRSHNSLRAIEVYGAKKNGEIPQEIGTMPCRRMAKKRACGTREASRPNDAPPIRHHQSPMRPAWSVLWTRGLHGRSVLGPCKPAVLSKSSPPTSPSASPPAKSSSGQPASSRSWSRTRLDAGATEVLVALEDGGKSLIEILDNGYGMGPEDLALCVRRHATSKLATVDDLEKIRTLGFRGEALPSVAAVSELSILSRAADSDSAYELKLPAVSDQERFEDRRFEPEKTTFGHFLNSPHGTRIQARGLFAQIPARLKFLKSQSAEVAPGPRMDRAPGAGPSARGFPAAQRPKAGPEPPPSGRKITRARDPGRRRGLSHSFGQQRLGRRRGQPRRAGPRGHPRSRALAAGLKLPSDAQARASRQRPGRPRPDAATGAAWRLFGKRFCPGNFRPSRSISTSIPRSSTSTSTPPRLKSGFSSAADFPQIDELIDSLIAREGARRLCPGAGFARPAFAPGRPLPQGRLSPQGRPCQGRPRPSLTRHPTLFRGPSPRFLPRANPRASRSGLRIRHLSRWRSARAGPAHQAPLPQRPIPGGHRPQ